MHTHYHHTIKNSAQAAHVAGFLFDAGLSHDRIVAHCGPNAATEGHKLRGNALPQLLALASGEPHRNLSSRSGLEAALEDAAKLHHLRTIEGSSTSRTAVMASQVSTLSLPDVLTSAAVAIALDSFENTSAIALQAARVAKFNTGTQRPVVQVRAEGPPADVTNLQGAAPPYPLQQVPASAGTLSMRSYGGSIAIPRKTLLMLDTPFIASLFAACGAKQAQMLDRAFCERVLEESDSWYSSGHGNRQTSAALSAESIAGAQALMHAQRDSKGWPIAGLEPRHVIVPPGLQSVAEKIVADAEPDARKRRLRVLSSPWLSLAGDYALPGASATTHYLLGDPRNSPSFMVGMIGSGVDVGPLESFTVDGLSFALVSDFGVARLGFAGAVKSTA